MQSYDMDTATEKLLEKLFDKNPDLLDHLNNEEADLDATRCLDETIGNYLMESDLPTLLDIILNASTEYFGIRFPDRKSFEISERHGFAKEVEDHLQQCEYCIIKLRYNKKWEEMVDSARNAVSKDNHATESNPAGVVFEKREKRRDLAPLAEEKILAKVSFTTH